MSVRLSGRTKRCRRQKLRDGNREEIRAVDSMIGKELETNHTLISAEFCWNWVWNTSCKLGFQVVNAMLHSPCSVFYLSFHLKLGISYSLIEQISESSGMTRGCKKFKAILLTMEKQFLLLRQRVPWVGCLQKHFSAAATISYRSLLSQTRQKLRDLMLERQYKLRQATEFCVYQSFLFNCDSRRMSARQIAQQLGYDRPQLC